MDEPAEFESPILRDSGVHSLLGAPMIVAGRLLGVVLAGKTDRYRFSTDDAEVLQMATDRMAVLFDRMRMFEAERRARTEVTTQRARLSAILEQIPSGVVVLDRDGKVVLHNAASRRMAGEQHDQTLPLVERASEFMVRHTDGRPLRLHETPGARSDG